MNSASHAGPASLAIAARDAQAAHAAQAALAGAIERAYAAMHRYPQFIECEPHDGGARRVAVRYIDRCGKLRVSHPVDPDTAQWIADQWWHQSFNERPEAVTPSQRRYVQPVGAQAVAEAA